MERAHQLLDVMNEVSARLDHAPVPARQSFSREPLNEMQAFVALDPLLADLQKQYLDAKSARLQSQKEHGAKDGMTDMAGILEDSAWCAMQTRYMELRSNRRLMSKAQQMMEDSRREEEEQARAQKEREAIKTFEQVQLLTRMRKAQENSDTIYWFLAWILMSGEQRLFRNHHATYRFNRLAA